MADSESAGRAVAAPLPKAGVRHIALRPLALPTEHGGWGILFEPILIGLLIAPSWGGALIALAALGAFLARQPLKLALQDAMRKKSFARTPVCWRLAAAYGALAFAAIAAAFGFTGWRALVPLAAAVPLGLVQVVYDAGNRSRALLTELTGPIAIGSTAAAMALAGGFTVPRALAVWLLLVARSLPAVVYVRALLRISRGGAANRGIPIAAHAAALAGSVVMAWFRLIPWLAVAAMAVLLARACTGLTRPVPPAKRIGWREIGFGTVFVVLVAIGYLI